ncbi:MAG: hypothetical protein B6U87_00835 [Candidatus Aenigmarchaeota archaeon ex4484_52]|nr:MAG: hypothetical protein B6U87_00835 [Candidatus Aenigmarchaeota archaeon ex4484_52]
MAGKILYKDDIFINLDVEFISYVGEWPFKIRRFIIPLLKQILEISSCDIIPKYIAWDRTDGGFKSRWIAEKDFDRWTKATIDIWCWGCQNNGIKGWMKAKIQPFLVTEYYYANSIQKSFWYSYCLLFYDNQRAKYAERGRHLSLEIWKQIQKKYGMRK